MLKIDILYVEGCSSTSDTLELVKEVIDKMGIKAQINTILIRNSEQAREYKLFGSPTVLVNGLDIDPRVRNQQWFGIT